MKFTLERFLVVDFSPEMRSLTKVKNLAKVENVCDFALLTMFVPYCIIKEKLSENNYG